MVDIEVQIQKDLDTVVYNVTEWAKDLLLWYLKNRVYDWGMEQKMYAYIEHDQEPMYAYGTGHATGQLYDSITADKQLDGVMTGLVKYLIYADPEKMDYDPESYVHGTPEQDFRNTILERLNNAMDDYGKARYPWWTSHDQFGRYHFFDDYLKELERDIYTQFEAEMRKVGWNPIFVGHIPDEHIYADI